jgi:plastocyanin
MLPFAILGACLAVGVLPALAADRGVGIHDFAFSPSKVAVMPGQTVTWTAEPGYTTHMHNVRFDDQATALGAPSSTFTASRTFDHDGAYTYHCEVHPSLMKGTVYVNATGTVPTPSPTPSPTASPTASAEPSTSPSPYPGGGGSGGGPAGSTTAPVSSFRLRAATRGRRVFLTLTIGAGESVRVKGTLRRGKRRVRSVTLVGRPGRHKLRLPGKRLKPGRYVLTLKAGDLKRVVRFTVRR